MTSGVLTVPETAERLKVSAKSVYKLIQSNQLPSINVGRSIRISEQALERFINDPNG